MKAKNILKSFLCYVFSTTLIINAGLIVPVYAEVNIPDNRDDEFGENNIVFYNPKCPPGSTTPGTGGDGTPFSSSEEQWDGQSCTGVTSQRAEFLKKQISGMQAAASKGGIPWELIAGQSIAESGGGSHEVCPYNPLGLKGAGPKCDGSHRSFSSYEEAYTHYIENITSIKNIKNKFPNDPYSAIAYIQYGVPHGQSYAQCSKEAYLTDPSHVCYGHQLGDPTPNYVKNTSSLICGIQKWAKENGYSISSVTWENYSPSSSAGNTTASINTSLKDTNISLALSQRSFIPATLAAKASSKNTDDSNSETTESSGASSAQWENGWIVDNSIPGILKEDASTVNLSETPQGSFPSGQPNKILLHSTEGTGVGLAAYPAGNKFPAHFTVDLKKKKGFQHFPLNKPAIAIKSYDGYAGIQIEIVGFSDTVSQTHQSSPYFLPNLSDEDWDYLAILLIAISNETGIPLSSSVTWTKDGSSRISSADAFKSYSGILGHQHAAGNDHIDPGPIWDKLSAAIARNPDGSGLSAAQPLSNSGSGASYCDPDGNLISPGDGNNNGSADGGSLADLVKRWAWPDYKNAGFIQRMPDYAAYIDTKAKYTGGACADGTKGVDCGAFVSNIIVASGWDPNYAVGSTSVQYTYLNANWTKVTDTSSLKLGDVGYRPGHVILYVGEIDGFHSKTASASLCSGEHRRAPMAGSPNENLSNYTWYRKK